MTEVYVIADADRCKVGIATKAHIRHRSLGGELMYVEEVGDQARAIEARAHQVLSAYALGGEWFAFDAGLCVAVVQDAIEERARAARNADHDGLLSAPLDSLTLDQQIKRIDAFLTRTGMKESRLGLLACANARAIERIRDRSASIETLDAVLNYIDAQNPRSTSPTKNSSGKR